MDVVNPYKFIGFGAMDVANPYEFIRFGALLRISSLYTNFANGGTVKYHTKFTYMRILSFRTEFAVAYKEVSVNRNKPQKHRL